MSKALELTAENFQHEVLNSDLPVLVDFWAPWCGPCQMMGPVLDAVSGDFVGKIKIAKLDIENPQHGEIAMQYGIQSIPNMKIFKGGKIVHEIIGLTPKETLVKEIEKFI